MTDGTQARSIGLRSVAAVVGFPVAFVSIYLLLILTRAGQELDSGSFGALGVFGVPAGAAGEVVRWGATFLLVAAALAAGAFALIRRRWNDAVRAALVVLVCTLGCEALKAVLHRPALGVSGYDDNTFPSGHMAVALSAATAVALTFPLGRWRRHVVVTSMALAVVAGWASIVSFAHRPSDVIGAGLLVGAVVSGVLFGRPPLAAERRPSPLLAACCAGAPVLAVLIGRWLSIYAPGAGDPLEALGWLALCALPVVAVVLFAPAARPAEE
ncbi:phosphatase PAP2 family protein [Humibacter sp.]|uniref:phosphatase PAP2 family protein n=1 Tax=Humibacter sp. TaxID=1940291 RepID=UPI003F807420